MHTWEALPDDVILSFFYLHLGHMLVLQRRVDQALGSEASLSISKIILGEKNVTYHHTILVRTKNHPGPRSGYTRTHPGALEHI